MGPGRILAQPTPAPAASPLAADTPSKTAAGVAFTAPRAWSVRTATQLVVVTAPEGDTAIVVVDVGQAKDASTAAALAWQLYGVQPHPVLLISPDAARSGWDERTRIFYETSPNEKRTIVASALRKGTNWTVLILDGLDATVEKREAAFELVAESLRPAGYQKETFAGRHAHAFDAQRIAALKSFVQTAMQELGVPGSAFALVDHGKLVYEGGLGVRELGKPEPVDANTLFMIASNTKGMTTLMLARLVDQGKLKWDEPVTQAYPSFRLGNDATTQKVRIKDLVCACTGLPRKDLQWLLNTNPSTPASDTFAQLAATQPTSGFGEVFQYNNLIASAAGYIGGHLVYPQRDLGVAYDDAMQNLIFNPLGMSSTTFDMARALAADHASPHGFAPDGSPAVASIAIDYSLEPYRPAGGAWSSAHDLIKYVEDELTLGKLPNGSQFVSPANLLARRIPGVPTGEDSNYGMGLIIDHTWGVTVIDHGGDLIGFHSDIIFIPDAHVGAVILTNGNWGFRLRDSFSRRMLELMYDGKPEAAEDVASAAALYKAGLAKARERLVIPAAADVSASLASRYVNPDLGHVDVVRQNGMVVFNFGSWSSQVGSRVNDDKSVSFITVDPGVIGWFEFIVGTQGEKRTLTIRDGQHEYVYIEAPAP
ncbi:MAG: beta-lactamase family protein [Candidatus Eremiobacteraeota bacterium]|nr:beta-lactamase family protein [Candidatus Eremiobacteraeota bacterium]MBV8366869.1 beta-lactamase family protein [Candidatus Eremiobacteraeota bacterium]